MDREKVIIRRIENYNAKVIQSFTKEVIKTLDIEPKPRAFIKPNLVQATRYAEHAYTHPELLRAIFRALRESGAAERILFEDCGLMMPLRYVFRKSGYKKLCREEGVRFLNLAEAIYSINHYRAWRSQEKVNPAARFLYRLLGQEPHQKRPRPLGVVVGDYKGDIPEELRNNLVFVGDCARANGLKPRTHLKGCPVFMARIGFQSARNARLLNPYLDVMEGLPFIRAFIEEQFMRGWNRVFHPLTKKN